MATIGRTVFVGREAELELLLGGIDDARNGRGRFIALLGEAGIGKTRTLEEFCSRAGLPDERILWGRCPEHHGLPAYWPWTQALGRFVESCDDATLARLLGRGAADVVQLVPAIAERLGGLEPTQTFDPAQGRLRIFEGIASFLRRSAELAPMVLVLDDLHWADEGSIHLLTFLAPELRRSHLLLLGTYRDRQMKRAPRLLAELTRVSERVALRGLALGEAGDFIRHKGGVAPRPALVEHLHGVSQGNPFFLDELVRMLASEGRLEQADGDLGAIVPDEVRQVVRRNLEPLSDADRMLLTSAASLGLDFDLAQLRAVSGLSPDELLERLQAAVDAGVLDEVATANGQYRFAHMLIRDALYGELAPLERARLHHRIGLALEDLHAAARDVPHAELARHFVHAAVLGNPAKALHHATRAGEQALARLAHEEAVQHFEVALKVQRLERPDEARELALRLSLGQAQTHAGDNPRARATFERAAERARALGDAVSLARAALGYATAAPGVGAVYPSLVALLEEALRLLGEEDGALRALVLGNLAGALYFSRDAGRREALSLEAVAMARRVGDGATLAMALIQRHHMLWRPGGIPERLAVCDEIEQLSALSGNRELGMHGLLWRLVDLLEAGDIATLDTQLDGFAAQAEHARIPFYRWFASVVRATRLHMDGRLAESEREADEALARWREDAFSLTGQTHAAQRLLVYVETGRLAEIEQEIAALARTYPGMVAWHGAVAIVHAESGRLEQARAIVDGYAARGFTDIPQDSNVLAVLVTFARIVHLLRDVDNAAALYDVLVPHAELYVSAGLASGTYGAVTRYLGLLAETTGRLDDAARHLADALAANTRLGSRVQIAHTQLDYARVLALRNERTKADALREEARQTAEQIGLTTLLAGITGAPDARTTARPHPGSAMFRRDGAEWTIAWAGRTIRVKHAKGYDYLLALLRSPGRDIHVLDLAVELPAATASVGDLGAHGQVRRDLSSDAGDVIDAQARAAYKRRLSDLEEELEEARGFNDLGRVDRLQEEIDGISDELSRAIGLGGRHRKAGSAAERARVNVSRAIASVLKKIGDEHPALGEHLAARVHTGTFCTYAPDPLVVVDWQL